MSIIFEGQYLDEGSLVKETNIQEETKIDQLGSTDTYNEIKLVEKIKKHPEKDLLCRAAIQIAIIGAGNKNYGFIRDSHNNVIELKTLFDRNKILYRNSQNAKLEDDTLTARRLNRIFRYHIKHFIEKTGRPSYLWLKYAPKKDDKYKNVCFPGAENLINEKDQAIFLYQTYNNLDKQLGTTNFLARLSRTFIARGVLNYEETINITKELART